MKKILIIAVLFASGMQARVAYIINDTNETVTVKGPTQPTNKIAIPIPLDPGKAIIKKVDSEGSINDTLNVTYIGNDSNKLKKLSRRFDQPVNIFMLNWTAPVLGSVQSTTLLQDATSF